MKLNNKGFAITTILYGTLILFLMLMLSMLGILSVYKDKMDLLIESDRGARAIINYKEIGYFDDTKTSDETNRFIFNREGLDVTITAKIDDGYGYVYYYMELKKDVTYVFNCDTTALNWGNGSMQTEAYLMKDCKDVRATNIHLPKNYYYYFKPSNDGLYCLRLDVNRAGETYDFYNIKILGRKDKMGE